MTVGIRMQINATQTPPVLLFTKTWSFKGKWVRELVVVVVEAIVVVDAV